MVSRVFFRDGYPFESAAFKKSIMNIHKTCPKCGVAVANDTDAGVCPGCLLKTAAHDSTSNAAVAPTFVTPASAGHGFVPPTASELNSVFPSLEILELIGRGGMGAVYRARQPDLDRIVAVKILPREIQGDPAFGERFLREARTLARLNHPNIVAVYDFGQIGDLEFRTKIKAGEGLGDEIIIWFDAKFWSCRCRIDVEECV